MGRVTNCVKKNTKQRLVNEDFDTLVIDTSLEIRLHHANNVNGANFLAINDHLNETEGNKQQFGGDLTRSSRLIQPKRPMNAFMVWAQAIRRYLHQKFSNVQNASLSKALGRVWRSMDTVSKEPFVKRAELIKAKHKRDFPNYRYQPRRIQEKRFKSNKLFSIHLQKPSRETSINHLTCGSADDLKIQSTSSRLAHATSGEPDGSQSSRQDSLFPSPQSVQGSFVEPERDETHIDCESGYPITQQANQSIRYGLLYGSNYSSQQYSDYRESQHQQQQQQQNYHLNQVDHQGYQDQLTSYNVAYSEQGDANFTYNQEQVALNQQYINQQQSSLARAIVNVQDTQNQLQLHHHLQQHNQQNHQHHQQVQQSVSSISYSDLHVRAHQNKW